MKKIWLVTTLLLAMAISAGYATEWYNAPGGAATSVNDNDRLLIEQGGVSKTATKAVLLSGLKASIVFPNYTGTHALGSAAVQSAMSSATSAASAAARASTYVIQASSAAGAAASASITAGTHASNAANAASTVTTQSSAVTASLALAQSSATVAATSATSAQNSASASFTSASQASTHATAAGNSASAAASSAVRAESAVSGASGYASAAASSAATANAAANKYSAQYTLKVDANGKVAGIGLFSDSTLGSKIQFTADAITIASGKTSSTSTTTGYWLGSESGVPKFSIGSSTKYLKWDGTNLTYTGNLANNDKFIRGRVSSSGAILSGIGFTVTKLGTGAYQINFTDIFSTLPTVVATADWFADGASASNYYVSTSAAQIYVRKLSGSTPPSTVMSDGSFSFIAMGTD